MATRGLSVRAERSSAHRLTSWRVTRTGTSLHLIPHSPHLRLVGSTACPRMEWKRYPEIDALYCRNVVSAVDMRSKDVDRHTKSTL
eukprot:330564-Chlamydomonas_euryale.AAC.1